MLSIQGPTEIALGCEDDAASAEAEVSGDFMADAPFAPLGTGGFYYVALPPGSALWMIKVLVQFVNCDFIIKQQLASSVDGKTG